MQKSSKPPGADKSTGRFLRAGYLPLERAAGAYPRIMTDKKLPITNSWTFENFAILDVTVTHDSPISGNFGSSSIRFDIGGGSIWLGTEERDPDSQQDFTIQLTGQGEHAVLAEAFRQIADQLDAAPSAS